MRYRSFIFTLLIFISAVVPAQIIPVKKFTIESETGIAKINVLFKKKNGYLLAGTRLGLFKFDGLKFSSLNFQNPDFIDNVTAIHEDRKGKMWIGFESGRIANIINNQLVNWNPEEGTPKQKINSIISDTENNIWFSTNGEGLYYTKNKHLYLINEEEGLQEQNINSICITKNKDIIAGTDKGLAVINNSKPKISIQFITPKDGLPDYIITTICPINENEYWLGFQDKGICLYNHLTKKIIIPFIDSAWKYGTVTSIASAQNNIWIGTENNGVIVMDSATKNLVPSGIMVEKNISDILPDDFGNIWIAGKDNTINRIPGLTIRIFPLPAITLFNHIHAILKDNSGNFWLTNQKNHLLVFDSSLTKLLHTLILPGITEKIDITSLYQDACGKVWVGTVGNGLFIIDPKNLSFSHFPKNNAFNKRTILSINGKNNKVFISSLEGTFYVLTDTTKNCVDYQFREVDIKSAGTNYVYAIFEDSKGDIWYATDGNGIIRNHHGSYTVYGKNVLTDDRIYSITEDRLQQLWFSTASHGIYKFNGSFHNYGLKEGLTDLHISTIRLDNSGNIVILHKKGIDILDPQSGKINLFNNANGIININTEDLDASTMDKEGNIFFSTENGVVQYAPVSQKLPQPKTIIESVTLFMKNLGDEPTHQFQYDDNNFTFNYTGLYYTDPEQVFFQYKLEGFDTLWINTKDRSVTFSKLPPGKYVFHIQSALNKQFFQADEATYYFTIKQAFYKTWWFITLCLIAIAAIFIVIVRNRERSLRRMETLRVEKIQFQFEVLRNQINPHFLFNSFNTLISIIDENPKIAIEYVEQLSDFFRDIVKYREKETITLDEELTLLQNYFYLQQKRFGEQIRLQVNISSDHKKHCYIPPLTLQLLMENAIKHNVFSKKNILNILVEMTASGVIVSNNINPKKEISKGEGMGLQNIINRYKLLTNKTVKINSTTDQFTVTLPMIEHA